MSEQKEITNNVLARFFSVEILGLLVAGGMAWGIVTSDVGALEEKVAEVKVEQKESQGDLGEVKQKLGVIETNQEHFKEKFRQQEESVDKILEILERQDRGG